MRGSRVPDSVTAGLAAMVVALSAPAAEFARPSNAEILFRLTQPCPATGQTGGPCKGYVIDRVIPRVCGGADDPGNMQWQTIAEAKDKDRWERIGCRRGRRLVLPGESTSDTQAFGLGELPAASEVKPLPLE